MRADPSPARGQRGAVGDREPRSVAVHDDDGVGVVAREREVHAVPIGICAPSSGEVIEIVGATGSVTPLSSSA